MSKPVDREAWAPGPSSGPVPVRSRGRRPLRRRPFVWSRQADQDPEGFYYQPVGLCDDYPEETTSEERIQRDFSLLRRLGIPVFRFGIGWDHIAEEPDRFQWEF